MAHDLVITGGTIIDGTGLPSRPGHVAIDADRITAIGPEIDIDGAVVIDANGAVVTPGFVDLHTHLDAQVAWDPIASSSCYHGVTSIVLGNCGVTFAPVKPTDHSYLAEMMESVEDIPAASIMEGVPFAWETYGEYLAWIRSLPKGINIGGMVGHCAVRYYAMGDRSLDPGAEPTPDELALMLKLVDEAMVAGATGFSTSRTGRHTAPDGRNVPGTWATEGELVALAKVLGRHGKGMFGAAPRFDGEGLGIDRARREVALMGAMSRVSGRPFTFNLTNTFADPELWRQTVAFVDEANVAGANLRPQTTTRGIGVIFSLDHKTPFDNHGVWRDLAGSGAQAKLDAFADPVRRAALVADGATAAGGAEGFRQFFVLHPDRGARYDCDPADSLTAHAERRGVAPVEAYIDLCLETAGAMVLNWPVLNQDFGVIEEMLQQPQIMLGLADAGAHVGQILDASQPTFFLSYWARERGLVSIEEAIRRLTSETASFAGFSGRGILRAGAKADVNIIDWDGLHLPLPTFERDFPGGAGRFVQKADGYVATVVNGSVFMRDGVHTGALTGQTLTPT